jgi:hypothetical protein
MRGIRTCPTLSLVAAALLSFRSVLAVSADDGAVFLAKLREGLRTRNVRLVTALCQYPFRITVPRLGYPVAVNTPADMARLYDVVFNPLMRCAIERSDLPSVDVPHPAFKLAIADGVVTLADGRVIAVRTPEGFKITRLTLLPGAKPPTRGPRFLTLFRKEGQVQTSGILAYDDVDAYVIRLRQNVEFSARIEGFPGRALVLRVRAPGGSVLRGAATEFARAWTGRSAEAGEYRIEIARKTAYCDPEVTYVLTVAVR